MNHKKHVWGAVLFLFLSACQQHFISDGKERQEVEQCFKERKEILQNKDIFNVFSKTKNQEENEALQFMYAYMPLGDLSDYSGEFHLANVRTALQARQEMPWGKDIPQREFRHFVLPYRVNNENLDSARIVFYNELKPRIQHLSLKDAVLEINHWCHEKVAYTPSDMRTSAPLATVRTAYGRCGEESTFAVSAFRAMCIPARQVYTPRWAHTDDNHAWVEVWVDGQWHFLGACEPEPVLDLAWFNTPASRGMLMHTKVFGHYHGPEEVMETTNNYTEINVIKNYANAATATITVTDLQNQPVKDALVEFKLYNYAEFYTVARKITDADGKVTLTAGLGDMLVWASSDGRYGYAKCSFGKDKTLTIVLDKSESESETVTVDLDIVSPVEKAHIPQVTSEQRDENNRRFAYEDSIRHAYIATFPTKETIARFAQTHHLDPETITSLITASRGNYQTIMTFLQSISSQNVSTAIRLLQVISEKDLRDVELSTLSEHLKLRSPKPQDCPQEIYDLYLLNPRVANEMILPYRQQLRDMFSQEEAATFRQAPDKLAAWCIQNIRIRNDWNPQRIPMSPAGVCRARVADDYSLQIFFVATARSLGIPARIDEVTGKVQYFMQGAPVDVQLSPMKDSSVHTTQPGRLTATYTATSWLDDPKYYNHFTLSKLVNGRLQLLNYPEGITTWSNLLKGGTSLDAGDYALMTGTRLADGSVLARIKFFAIQAGQDQTIDLSLRQNSDAVQVIGNFNSENLYLPAQADQSTSLLSTTGRGYYIIGILGTGQEPTNHALRDIAALKADFEKWGRKMVLLFPDKAQSDKFRAADFPSLPSTIVWGTDINGMIQKEITSALKLPSVQNLPIFIIADTFNRVVFVSQGYTIGLGEQLIKTIHGL